MHHVTWGHVESATVWPVKYRQFVPPHLKDNRDYSVVDSHVRFFLKGAELLRVSMAETQQVSEGDQTSSPPPPDSDHISKEDIFPSIKTPWKSQRRRFFGGGHSSEFTNLTIHQRCYWSSDFQHKSSCKSSNPSSTFINRSIIKLQCIKTSRRVRCTGLQS